MVSPVLTPLADELPSSPSEVTAVLNCPARWNFKYRERLPDPKTGALAVGIAFHAAQRENFMQKIETKRDLPLEGVRTVFRDSFAAVLESTELRDDEDATDLRECGEMLLAKYMDEAAPRIQPAAVELPVSGVIGGVKVQGKIDLLDVDGRIIDTKTAAKKPVGIDHRFQVATYVQLEPRATGAARIDTLVKTKTVALVQQSFVVDEADRKETAVLYPLALDAMRSGIYLPNRGSYLCSRKHCPFWRACEARYGGQVKGCES